MHMQSHLRQDKEKRVRKKKSAGFPGFHFILTTKGEKKTENTFQSGLNSITRITRVAGGQKVFNTCYSF